MVAFAKLSFGGFHQVLTSRDRHRPGYIIATTLFSAPEAFIFTWSDARLHSVKASRSIHPSSSGWMDGCRFRARSLLCSSSSRHDALSNRVYGWSKVSVKKQETKRNKKTGPYILTRIPYSCILQAAASPFF